MSLSIFDVFKIGVGPSSSHTVGPMIAAVRFGTLLKEKQLIDRVDRIYVQLFGSLGATGIGHGSDIAVMVGLHGHLPDTVDINLIPEIVADVRHTGKLNLMGQHEIKFDENSELVLNAFESLPQHPNGMRFTAFDDHKDKLFEIEYFSVGGGFVSDEEGLKLNTTPDISIPYPFKSAQSLLNTCSKHDMSIAELMMANEKAYRSEEDVREGILKIWQTMKDCVDRGLRSEGVLPGGFNVRRRAHNLHQYLLKLDKDSGDPLTMMDWVNVFAIAVNEENAAGGRVVTAPTNGASGVIPAVLHYFIKFSNEENTDDQVIEFLLTAAAIGILYKENASISGAEVGCQGEVGVACSMAAAALAAVQGGSVLQVENAAEIGMEHNLGMTCDPIGGLVQVPCIERNAMGAVKAINAARMAIRGDGMHIISLDKVILTMKQTGKDMMNIYKETSQGGLAVNLPEC